MLTDGPNRTHSGFARRYRDLASDDDTRTGPPLSTRFASFVIDWLFCILLADGFIAALHFLRVPLVIAAVLALFVLVAYFAAFWSLGRSPGMRLMGLRAVAPATGDRPSVNAALIRALLTVPGGAAFIVLMLYLYVGSLGHEVREGTGLPYGARIAILLVIASPYIVVAALSLRHPARRMLHDRIAGIRIIEAPTE
ncbi:MAG: RDD family protein [Tepidiformaceae bacterium]